MYVRLLLKVFASFAEEEHLYAWFQQDLSTAHSGNNSLMDLQGVFYDNK
jgi:hypothetical protein